MIKNVELQSLFTESAFDPIRDHHQTVHYIQNTETKVKHVHQRSCAEQTKIAAKAASSLCTTSPADTFHPDLHVQNTVHCLMMIPLKIESAQCS